MVLAKLISSYAFLVLRPPGCFSSCSPALSNENLSCVNCKEKFLASYAQGKLSSGILVNWSIAPAKLIQGHVPPNW